uniref:Predicted protein n=1 Tax=Hordeum vulgare subsp. vulgare TaxID=112509 RepID=F2EK64_HORVV|nr:predicted protein [Hordeum vulgare subsp. vulgare]
MGYERIYELRSWSSDRLIWTRPAPLRWSRRTSMMVCSPKAFVYQNMCIGHHRVFLYKRSLSTSLGLLRHQSRLIAEASTQLEHHRWSYHDKCHQK